MAKDFSESIRQPVLWNLKADLKNWHLMVYNWNKFPEIGPGRETSACVRGMVSLCTGEGPPLPPSAARDFSLLIRQCEEFRSASAGFSVLTELFDEKRAAGERLSSCLKSLSPLSSSCCVL